MSAAPVARWEAHEWPPRSRTAIRCWLEAWGRMSPPPVLTPNIKYDSARDFEPIGLTANAPAVIVARKDFPAENLSEFVAYLKENGEKLKQAHGGIGASSHMA